MDATYDVCRAHGINRGRSVVAAHEHVGARARRPVVASGDHSGHAHDDVSLGERERHTTGQRHFIAHRNVSELSLKKFNRRGNLRLQSAERVHQ